MPPAPLGETLIQLLKSLSTQRLTPFGLTITARPGEAIQSIPQVLLDELVLHEKLVLLRGFTQIARDDFLGYCTAFPGRELLQWDFGPVMEMKEKPEVPNYLFSREAVPFHWDGAFHKEPSYLMFCCVEAPTSGAGGETLFCDTSRIWNDLTAQERTRLSGIELTYETKKLAHYGGRITTPLVREHPQTREKILRFAEPVETALNPVSLNISGVSTQGQSEFLATMRDQIYNPAYCYRHEWQPHDILIADNHALIHGRRAFERDCPRHLRRIQLI